MLQLITQTIQKAVLKSYDPYDVWTTGLGVHVKRYYHSHPRLGYPAAAAVLLGDRFVNNRARIGYTRREYASVRAMAAQAAILMHRHTGDSAYLNYADMHLRWLAMNALPARGGGIGWGHGFRWVVSGTLTYAADAPLSTTTPYVLEAMVLYTEATGSQRYLPLINQILAFYDNGLARLIDNEMYLGTSYTDQPDRLATNAVSYVMYGYALSLDLLSRHEARRNRDKIRRMKQLIEAVQRRDGSWLYAPYENSFIDCFHSCMVVKNLKKTELRLGDRPSGAADRGYRYIKTQFYVPADGLMKRFTLAPRAWTAKYDLYDTAEAVIVACLLGDAQFAQKLVGRAEAVFVRGAEVFSEIDQFGRPRNPNMLRWAVMPAFLAYMYVHIPEALAFYGTGHGLGHSVTA